MGAVFTVPVARADAATSPRLPGTTVALVAGHGPRARHTSNRSATTSRC